MQVLREQRLDERFEKSLPLRVQFEDANGFSGEMVNLSSRGLSCRVPCYVPPFSRLHLNLELPFSGRPAETLRIDALVVRTEEVPSVYRSGEYQLGLLFLHLNQDRAALINTYLKSLATPDRVAVTAVKPRTMKTPSEACLTSRFNPQEFLQDYKLSRLDQLACLAELSSVLAHEIKNPLACLAGSLQILSEDIGQSLPVDGLFNELFGQIDRIDHIVDHLNQFTVSETAQLKPLRIDEVIDGTLGILGGKLKDKNIQVDLCHGVDQPLISADERLLRQAFLNLFANVVDSMERDGHFCVNTHWPGKQPVCSRDVCGCCAEAGCKGLSVVVMDTGSKEQAAATSFKPLSLAERKKRGLNLSLTQQIIEQHKGSVFIQNQAEAHSVLMVTLPL